MSLLRKLAPTSASIQKEFVQKRLRAVYKNDQAKTDAVKQVIEALMGKYNVQGQTWHQVYLTIQRQLQAADLTINFDAGRWFTKDNTYATYAQMYERGVGADGKMVIDDSDWANPAIRRAMTDDLVTLPDEWAYAHPFSQRKRLYEALNVTGATMTDAPKAQFAGPKQVPRMKRQGAGYTTTNKHFKPKAKQVFAALNYGRRLHGSTTGYGFSYLTLKPTLKQKALFFPGDTFYLVEQGTKPQAGINTIGAVLEYAQDDMVDDIWKSCYQRQILADDPGHPNLLLEAHIFQTVRVNRDIEECGLSRQRKSSSVPPWTEAEWANIVNNARAWCQRNSVRLVFLSP